MACQLPPLAPGTPVERRIAPEQEHRYSLDLQAGSLVEIQVDQDGVDVAVRLLDPEGQVVVEVDRLIRDRGPERLVAVAESTGAFTLGVEAFKSNLMPGIYRIELQSPRAASPMDRLRARTVLLVTEGASLLGAGRALEARERLEAALDLSRRTRDRFWEAESLDRLGHLALAVEHWDSAAQLYLDSSAVFRGLGDQRMEGRILIRAGLARFEAGRMDEAAAHYRDAIGLLRAEDDRFGVAMGRRNLGQIQRVRGEWQEALGLYQGALKLWDRPKDQEMRADTHHDLGVLYRILGDPDRAFFHLGKAEKAWSQLGDRRKRAISLNQLGRVYQSLEHWEQALAVFRESLELRRGSKNPVGQANTLVNMGLLLNDLELPEDAGRAFDEALALLDDPQLSSSAVEAKALLALGSFYSEGGDPNRALPLLRRSLEHYRERKDPAGQAANLLEVSRAQARRGSLAAARQAGEEALALVEGVRLRTINPRLRSTFFSTVQHFFEAHIDLLMRSHKEDPLAGFDAQALETSERARMRALVEMLVARRDGVFRGAEAELVQREQSLREALNGLAVRQLDFGEQDFEEGSAKANRASALATELRATEDALEAVQLEILQDSPRYASLIQPRPLRLGEIQSEVLDEETLLLEYHLGKESGYLWVVGTDSLQSFELPGRDILEPLVWQAYEQLKAGQFSEDPLSDAKGNEALHQLSRALLGPAAPALRGRRLAIVPDGVLHYFPFAALPDPAADLAEALPLIVGHEITVLPSASVLALVRRQLAERAPPPGLLAVIADPVFDRWDQRVGSSDPRPSASLSRLSFSGDEAEGILALVPPELSFKAMGFDATRELILGGDLGRYQILHLATHVILPFGDKKAPAILLSGVGEEGEEIEGRLFARDLYDLELPAELVVLSGCSTALGENLRGEGLVGLSRALMYAGSERVLGSVWDVSDLGTVSLMTSFYRHLLAGPMRPAAALRQAQIDQFEAGKPASLWAPFVLQGDWRGWPALPAHQRPSTSR